MGKWFGLDNCTTVFGSQHYMQSPPTWISDIYARGGRIGAGEVNLETGALLHHSFFRKETPMTRKLVIEVQYDDDAWNTTIDVGPKAVANTINELGTFDCPDVQRHLDKFLELYSRKPGRLKYRWRIVEEKPVGRPAKLGERVVRERPVKASTDWGIVCNGVGPNVGVAWFDKDGPKWSLHIPIGERPLYFLDGAPVTGYDPS